MRRPSLSSDYWQALADAYQHASGSPVKAVEDWLRSRDAHVGPRTARNKIYEARRRGYLPRTAHGTATAGPQAAPLLRLADVLRVDPAELRIAVDAAEVRVLSAKTSRSGGRR